jgi:hypothetical protein
LSSGLILQTRSVNFRRFFKESQKLILRTRRQNYNKLCQLNSFNFIELRFSHKFFLRNKITASHTRKEKLMDKNSKEFAYIFTVMTPQKSLKNLMKNLGASNLSEDTANYAFARIQHYITFMHVGQETFPTKPRFLRQKSTVASMTDGRRMP